MTLDSIANVIDIVSGVAVVVSLLYLSAQLRQNTRALKAATYNSATANTIAILGPLASQPEYSDFLSRMNSIPDTVTPAEKIRFNAVLLIAFRHWDNLYYQFRSGALDDEMWQSYKNTLAHWLANEAWRIWFRDNANCFSQHLCDLVDSVQQTVQLQSPEA